MAERSAPRRHVAARTSLRGVAVRGVEPGYMLVDDLPIALGRPIGDGTTSAAATVCVIGADVADELFGSLDPLGRELRLGTRP